MRSFQLRDLLLAIACFALACSALSYRLAAITVAGPGGAFVLFAVVGMASGAGIDYS